MPMDIDETIKFGWVFFLFKVFYGKQILQNLYVAQ